MFQVCVNFSCSSALDSAILSQCNLIQPLEQFTDDTKPVEHFWRPAFIIQQPGYHQPDQNYQHGLVQPGHGLLRGRWTSSGSLSPPVSLPADSVFSQPLVFKSHKQPDAGAAAGACAAPKQNKLAELQRNLSQHSGSRNLLPCGAEPQLIEGPWGPSKQQQEK